MRPKARPSKVRKPAGSARKTIAASATVASTAQRRSPVSTKRSASQGATRASSIVQVTPLIVRAASTATGEIASKKLSTNAGSGLR